MTFQLRQGASLSSQSMATPSFSKLAMALSLVALTGTASAQTSANSTPSIEKCSKELGSIAVAEPQAHTMAGLGRYGLGSPSTMLRMMIQESGCFAVLERGVAMQNMQQERALANNGMLQQGSNIGGGQMQGADFVMTPAVQFSGDTGGMGATVGNLLGRVGPLGAALGGVAGGVKFGEAETTLLVADVRSGIQVASAEGKATRMNFSVGAWGWGGLGWASGGGYTKTPEGKLIAASLLDNYNKIVTAIRDKPSLIRNTVAASNQNAANATLATGHARPVAPVQSAVPVMVAPAGAVVAVPQRPQSVAAQGQGKSAFPVSFIGSFSGTVEGGEAGVFALNVVDEGAVNGTAQTIKFGALTLTGVCDQYGTVMAEGKGDKGEVVFRGSIDPRSGALVGEWRSKDGSLNGAFKGQRGRL